MQPAPAEGLSFTDYARRIGKTRQRVGQLVREGKLPTLPNGRIDPEAADAALRAAALLIAEPDPTGAPAVGKAGTGTGTGTGRGGALLDAKTEREAYAARSAALDFHQRVGDLVASAAVRADQLDTARRVRDGILATVPELVAAVMGADGDERVAAARVRQLVTLRLAALAQDLADDAARLASA